MYIEKGFSLVSDMRLSGFLAIGIPDGERLGFDHANMNGDRLEALNALTIVDAARNGAASADSLSSALQGQSSETELQLDTLMATLDQQVKGVDAEFLNRDLSRTFWGVVKVMASRETRARALANRGSLVAIYSGALGLLSTKDYLNTAIDFHAKLSAPKMPFSARGNLKMRKIPKTSPVSYTRIETNRTSSGDDDPRFFVTAHQQYRGW